MNTDKQTQTVYIEANPDREAGTFHIDQAGTEKYLSKIQNVYIFTHEELEALKVKWQREAAENGWDASNEWEKYNKFVNFDPGPKFKEYWKGLIPTDKEIYLNTHYPLPQPPKK